MAALRKPRKAAPLWKVHLFSRGTFTPCGLQKTHSALMSESLRRVTCKACRKRRRASARQNG